MCPKNVSETISSAIEFHKENSRLIKIAAAGNRNFVEYWFDLHTTSEDQELKAALGYTGGRGFQGWWEDLYESTKRISEIANIFKIDIIPNHSVLWYGQHKLPVDSTFTHGIDDNIFDELDEKLELLCRYLYVWLFRKAKSGDTTDYSRFLSANPDPTATSSQSFDTSLDVNELIDAYIPKKMKEPWSVTKPADKYVDAYSFTKSAFENFMNKVFGGDNVAKRMMIGLGGFNYDRYWRSLPKSYGNDSEIMFLLESMITIDPSIGAGTDTLINLASRDYTNYVDSRQITETVQNLINLIRVREVERLKKLYGFANTAVSLATIPTQQSYRFLADSMEIGANRRSR